MNRPSTSPAPNNSASKPTTVATTMSPPDPEAIAYRLRHATVDRQQKAPPLRFDPAALDAMARLAEDGYPHEVCGLLVGTAGPGGPEVVRLAPAKNLRQERAADRYLLDPDDFVAADAQARREGCEIIGIWHSHPDSPAWPSVTDLEAAWQGYSYVIVCIRQGRCAEVRSWRLGDDRLFLEEPVTGRTNIAP